MMGSAIVEGITAAVAGGMTAAGIAGIAARVTGRTTIAFVAGIVLLFWLLLYNEKAGGGEAHFLSLSLAIMN